MSNPSFKKTPLAFSVAMALGMGGGSQAVAQDAGEDETIEEIVTTGIRSSLSTAQAMKENAETFVDGVTASDIGALPDRSVAEALQRVPGVNIGRFKKTTDPDRFSVEGADVIIRGLGFVRSELNGRDVFSATGGTVLSFNDVSPELLGSVLVYKNATADMIDGGIAGTVDLVTRKPLDTDGLRLAGSAEYNYGDIAEEGSPTISFLGSNTWDTAGGSFGLQLGYAQSELNTRSYASQVTDPCYRDPSDFTAATGSGCIRVSPVGSGGVGGDLNFTPETFPPDGSVIVPKGAGVRTTGYERDRQALSLVGQWESDDGGLLVTAEYLRAEADLFVDENAILALVNDDGFWPEPAPGTDWTFGSNGSFQSGVLSQVAWRGLDNCAPGSIDTPDDPAFVGDRPCLPQVGIPTETLRFQREDQAVTEDVSLDISWNPTDNLSLNFEAQYLEAERTEDGIIGSMQTYSEIFLDMTGETPDVQFRVPTTTDGSTDPNYFTNPDRTYHWFLLDSLIENEADMTTFRADLDYYFDDDALIRGVKFGARWSDRNRITRDNRFQNWGALSVPWTGNQSWAGEGWEERQAVTFAGDPAVTGYANIYNPFRDFQRGEASVPVPGGAAWYYGGPNFLNEYLSGTTADQGATLRALNFVGDWGGENWEPVDTRPGLVEGTPFLPGEISDVSEQTKAAYFRVDFGVDGDTPISGNVGVRYVKTDIEFGGELQFPSVPPNPDLCNVPGLTPGYCDLSPEREAEFLSAFTGEIIPDTIKETDFEHWLPSFNIKIGVTDDFLIRAAASKGISRPDLGSFAAVGVLGDNTNTLKAEGTLETGPLFAIPTGNVALRPVEAWSYDLSAEWYFSNVGSLTLSLFRKEFENLITQGARLYTFTTESGATAVTEVRAPDNLDDASMQGFELAYQQTFDFLPEPFNGLGAQATYTYVDASDLKTPTDATSRQPFAAGAPLPGVSEDTFNLVAFYETDVWSARLAYNWRSEYLLTARDDIFPFSPIYGEDTGQLDGSIFYNFLNFNRLENFKIGLQMVNILDEVTQTSQIVNFDGLQFPRSAYRNDRRYTLVARFEF